MTDETETSATAGANAGVKRGLPQAGLDDAAKSATSLWEVARLGLTQKEAFAAKLGRKGATGGGWDALTAQMRGFGLLKIEGDQIGLSDLGLQLVNGSDPDKQRAARRTALMKLKAYRELVDSFDGTVAPDIATLGSRFKFEYGKSDEFAAKAAHGFIASLKFAEMLDPEGIIRKAGPNAAIPGGDSVDDSEEAELGAEDQEHDDSLETPSDETESDASNIIADPRATQKQDEQTVRRVQTTRSSSQSEVTFSVSIDLSNFRADEVLQILKALPK